MEPFPGRQRGVEAERHGWKARRGVARDHGPGHEAVSAWRRTGGLFDPTVLTALVGAGYDRSFERLEADGPAAPLRRPPGCGGVVVRPSAGLVILPAGEGLDFGGMAKGLAADWVVEQLLEDAAGACVNMGGDLRVAGEPPEDDGWVVAVEHPAHAGSQLVSLALSEGAVCTSSRLRRRWRRSGGPAPPHRPSDRRALSFAGSGRHRHRGNGRGRRGPVQGGPSRRADAGRRLPRRRRRQRRGGAGGRPPGPPRRSGKFRSMSDDHE